MPAHSDSMEGRTDRGHENLPRWLSMLIGVLLVSGSLLAFWWWLGYEASGVARQPVSFGGSTTIRSLETLLEETQAGNLLDRPVRLDNVPVQHVAGDYLFWIGFDEVRRIPVVLFGELTERQAESVVQVRPGERLRIFGTVRPLIDLEGITRVESLSAAERDALRRYDLFVSADRVAPVGGE